MKKFALLHAAFLTAFFSFQFSHKPYNTNIIDAARANIVTCTPDRSQLSDKFAAMDIPLLPGSGSYLWKIKDLDDSAQLYFNQGINTYYGFHIIESLASFKRAAQLDPDNPMVWWGQALAYGPNINDVEYNTTPEATAASKKALDLMANASPVEQALIKAMSVRYSDDTAKQRTELDQLYTGEMKKAYMQFPGNADVAALYADAMMLHHPWDLWNIDGTPKEWTPAIQEVLEKNLPLSPLHPGLNHYYIHIVEASPNPEKAMASAEVLGSITPGLAHLVHMPSHIYLRTGNFNKGTDINQQAVNRFKEYSKLFPAVTDGAFIYYLHNQHMLVNCAMHAGRYQTAYSAASELQQAIDSATLHTPPPMGSLIQYVYMSPVLIHTRFEKWDSLLSIPAPDNGLVYANILYRFGRGMAYTGKNKTEEARKESGILKELLKNEDLRLPMTPFSSAIEGAVIADHMLMGAIYLREKRNSEAIDHFNQASQTELKMVYNEPRDWFLNPHQYLGVAYLKNKQYKLAESAFRKDLSINADNIWSLRHLGEALQKQSRKKEAAKIRTALGKASAQADIKTVQFYY